MAAGPGCEYAGPGTKRKQVNLTKGRLKGLAPMIFGLSIFDIVFIVVFVTGICIRAPYDRANNLADKRETRFDAREKAGLLLAVSGAILLPAIYLFTPLLNFADYSVNPFVGTTGAVLSGPAMWAFWRSHKDLGRQYSPKLEVKQSHQLITEGIYKHVRHPMYTAVLLNSICQLCLIGNWIAGPAYLVGFSVLYWCRIDREEAMMLDQFGESYRDYMTKTNRWFPKVRWVRAR